MLSRFDRYLARLILVPLLATLTIAAMLLLLDRMLKLFDFVINEGGPVSVVWRMLGNLIPQYLGLGIPIGLFLGVLLAFRRLALSSELDALIATGVSYTRLLRVPMLYALLFAAINIGLVGFMQPYSRYAYEGLRFELRSGALGASINVGEFAKFGDRMILRVERSENKGSDLLGVFAQNTDKNGRQIAISASRGSFMSTDDPNTLVLRLYDGMLSQIDSKSGRSRVLSFAVHDVPIALPRIEAFRARGGRELEFTLPELWQNAANPEFAKKEQLTLEANFYRRLVQAFILLVLPPLALALAVPPKRSSNAVGVFIGVAFLVIYNEISEFAERVGAAGQANAALVQGVPFLIFALFSLWMFSILAYRVGGQPLGLLFRLGPIFAKPFQWIAAPFKRLLRPAWER
jgi:lipopolysaccharide export system permease protein